MTNEQMQQLKTLAELIKSGEYSINACNEFIEASGPEQILALIAKVESLAADAARYRHLRKPEFGNLLYCSVVAGECGENLDRVVDEDMTKEKV